MRMITQCLHKGSTGLPFFFMIQRASLNLIWLIQRSRETIKPWRRMANLQNLCGEDWVVILLYICLTLEPHAYP
ncbi:unnamed protein product [Moneuplotes crassus]|uniref:Uncharacterized protein n=1 Tax=Euplotes crassus TaxID=5936 RepID=A0AAD1XPB3_EUPCR|nr:unnamed protein product [Moneuplotes crassus]